MIYYVRYLQQPFILLNFSSTTQSEWTEISCCCPFVWFEVFVVSYGLPVRVYRVTRTFSLVSNILGALYVDGRPCKATLNLKLKLNSKLKDGNVFIPKVVS